MSNVVDFKLNRGGVKEVLCSAAVQAECGKYAQQIYSSVCGTEGYHVEPRKYPERCGYAVYASEYPAIKDNLENNTLLKAGGV